MVIEADLNILHCKSLAVLINPELGYTHHIIETGYNDLFYTDAAAELEMKESRSTLIEHIKVELRSARDWDGGRTRRKSAKTSNAHHAPRLEAEVTNRLQDGYFELPAP